MEEATCIQVTTDTPERDEDGRLPVLDTKLWVHDNQVLYTFYKKKVSSPYTILKGSALSEIDKKDTIFQEGLRRLNNVSISLP